MLWPNRNVWRPNIVKHHWWSNILPFGHLVWSWLMVSDDVWSCLNSIKYSIKLQHFFCCHVCFRNVWFVWPGVSSTFSSRMRDALSQIPPCWNCCGTLGNFVAHNSLRSDVWRCLAKYFWTVWPGFQTSKCLITKQWWCSVVKHFPFGQGFISCVACHCDIEKSYDLTLTFHSLPSPATKMFTYESK